MIGEFLEPGQSGQSIRKSLRVHTDHSTPILLSRYFKTLTCAVTSIQKYL